MKTPAEPRHGDDGREIEPDDKLATIVGSQRLTMFEPTAKANRHIRTPEQAGRH